jgi:hypothetical protein
MSGGAGDVGLAPVERGYHALRSPEWRDMEERNAAAMLEFQRQLAARNGSGGAYAEAAEDKDRNPTFSESAGDPHERLAATKLNKVAKAAKVVRCRDAHARGRDRADADQRDLARFDGVDDRLTRLLAQRAYDDSPDVDLPLSEQITLSERQRCIERQDLSARALRYIETELHAAEQEDEQADRELRAAASAVLMEQAAFLAAELVGVQAHEAELRARLRAYGDATLPGIGGATPLPAAAVQALNAVREEVGRDLAREVELRRQHTALMDD